MKDQNTHRPSVGGFKREEKREERFEKVFLAPSGLGTSLPLGTAADLPSFEVTIVEEKAVVGTWPVLAIPFPPCLSRKRQSWEHGVCLRFPFPPSCRGNDNHGNTPCACETLFPLPDKEKAVVGCLRFAFPAACRGKGLSRDSAGLRGWGAHGAPQGPEGLRGALQGFVAWNCLSLDRQGEMAITGTLVWGIVQDLSLIHI